MDGLWFLHHSYIVVWLTLWHYLQIYVDLNEIRRGKNIMIAVKNDISIERWIICENLHASIISTENPLVTKWIFKPIKIVFNSQKKKEMNKKRFVRSFQICACVCMLSTLMCYFYHLFASMQSILCNYSYYDTFVSDLKMWKNEGQ